MLKVLIPVDGSDPSKHAIEVTARFAKHTSDLQAVLVNVRHGPHVQGDIPPRDYQSIDQAEIRHQGRLLDNAATHARALGIPTVSVLAASGNAASEIVLAAEQEGVDQIVMGTRGLNSLGGLLLGSVAQRVVHLARLPVVLVK
jgi:nucleotide-binding universal stress UspA family protein